MLELTGGIALGVQVGNLFELERAFERDRIVDATADVHEILVARIFLRQGL